MYIFHNLCVNLWLTKLFEFTPKKIYVYIIKNIKNLKTKKRLQGSRTVNGFHLYGIWFITGWNEKTFQKGISCFLCNFLFNLVI